MASKTELALREILLETGLLVPVQVSGKGSRVSALCRELPGAGKVWIKAISSILSDADDADLKFHLCRQYIMKDGALVFGWHVGIEAKTTKDVERHLNWLKDALSTIEILPSPTPIKNQEQIQPVEQEEPETPPPADIQKRQADYHKHTEAAPRSSEGDLPGGSQAPEGFKPVIRRFNAGTMTDRRGNLVQVIVDEFPIPHTYTNDMNKPNAKGRGVQGM